MNDNKYMKGTALIGVIVSLLLYCVLSALYAIISNDYALTVVYMLLVLINAYIAFKISRKLNG